MTACTPKSHPVRKSLPFDKAEKHNFESDYPTPFRPFRRKTSPFPYVFHPAAFHTTDFKTFIAVCLFFNRALILH